jgi:hypothetical protein
MLNGQAASRALHAVALVHEAEHWEQMSTYIKLGYVVTNP